MSNDQNPPHSPAATLQENQWIAAIEEHLAAVRWCLDRSQHGGRIKGYSAALLLFCIIDAMGNGLCCRKRSKGGRYTLDWTCCCTTRLIRRNLSSMRRR